VEHFAQVIRLRDPIVSIDQFGNEANPLKHLTVGDVMDLLGVPP
jgi:hypothetical protein